MYDINFYMSSYDFMKKAEAGNIYTKEFVLAFFENIRNKKPIVYNIETTNACNMRCGMCPRTTMMTRAVETMNVEVFTKIIDQLKPFNEKMWADWQKFILDKYGIGPEEKSENHFYLLIIPKVIQLHGYGDPLLDNNVAKYVKCLTTRGFESYFSCNPANIDIKKTLEIFESGLTYIKYSIESVDDKMHKLIRGKASNYTDSYNKIIKLLKIKKERNYKTVVIITMLNLNRKDQSEEYEKLTRAFEGEDVYIYLKSEDQQWYRQDYHGTSSVHWREFCKHPWMSMSIKSNGEVAMCMEDFNNEIILGDVGTESLFDIWNGEKYKRFRNHHLDLAPGIKCINHCDMKLIGDFIVNKERKERRVERF